MDKRTDTVALLAPAALLLTLLVFSVTAALPAHALALRSEDPDDSAKHFACRDCVDNSEPGEGRKLLAVAQEFVGAVHGAGMLTRTYGTGWCLTPQCDLIVTGYHVVKGIGKHVGFRDGRAGDTFFATNENDQGARVLPANYGNKLSFKFSWVRDISVVSVPKGMRGMHGANLFGGELKPQEKVFLLGSTVSVGMMRGTKLQMLVARYQGEAQDGTLSFAIEGVLREGFSGGPVLNQAGK